mmetsp:Transcript_16062/g.47525  ORF Transcript_16062/g.47525 Transcript_16062/m.47525 type:complete len:433 (-) Transcript_16062:104-1402(-)
MASRLAALRTQAFTQYLRAAKISRFYLVPKDGKMTASHPELDEVAQWMSDSPDREAHEGVFGAVGPKTGVLQLAGIHRTCRGQGAGGLRWMPYDSVGAALTDALRLSRGMTYKNALAGLWWGGGKGVMAREPELAYDRKMVFEEYGRFITSLNGAYITAEDVGVTPEDIATVFTTTRFAICVPESMGGSGNPSTSTARGVLCAIEAGLEQLGMAGLHGRSFAVQGVGHVGLPLVKLIADRGARKIIVHDVSKENLCRAKAELQGVDVDLELRLVVEGDNSILASYVDVVSPNATGGSLNAETIPTIKAPLVCGAANNQLADDTVDDKRLMDAGILYLPDFLVNRMGIVYCADEHAGRLANDPNFEKHLGTEWEGAIKPLALRVLAESASTGRTPAAVALDLAKSMSVDLHPIFGHRGQAIIDSIVDSDWSHR